MMANKSYYTFMRIKSPEPSKEALAAFTRKINEQFEASTMKLYGNIEAKDLHPNLLKTMKSKVDNVQFETYIQQTAQQIALLASKEEVNDALDDYADELDALTALVDGSMTIWYAETDPAGKQKNDIWFRTTPTPYLIQRWTGTVYVDVSSTLIARALIAAYSAQVVADGKIRVFRQTEAPTGLTATDMGDLWFDTDDNNKLWCWNGTAWVSAQDTHLDATVSTHTTQIQQNADAIALKADQSTVDSLGNTVSSMSSELSLVPGQITAAVTNKSHHYGATPPPDADMHIGKIWVLPDGEQVYWRGVLPITEKLRRYSRMASGESVVIPDLSDDRALRVTVKNAITQTTTPTLGNQQPLAGKSTARVARTGKNILRPGESVAINGVTMAVASDGTVTLNGTCTAAAGSPSMFSVQMAGFYLDGQFTLSMNNAAAYGSDLQLRLLEDAGSAVLAVNTNIGAASANATGSFALANQYIWGYAIRVGGGITYDSAVIKPQLEPGADATPYEPYNGAEYTLSLPAPAYGVAGATDDVNNIGQTAYRTKYMKFSGTEAWQMHGTQPTLGTLARFYLPVADIKPNALGISSAFGWVMGPGAHTASEAIGGHTSVKQINVFVMKSRVAGSSGTYPEAGSNADKVAWFKALMTYYKPEIVYELATPTTATIAPVQITGADGVNIVASDGASIAVDYTGSGWGLASAEARRVYASSNFTIDENGATVRHVLLDGITPYEAYTRLYGGGLEIYETSSGEFIGGLRVVNGKVVMSASAISDPRSDSNFACKVFSEPYAPNPVRTVIGLNYTHGDESTLKLYSLLDANGMPVGMFLEGNRWNSIYSLMHKHFIQFADGGMSFGIQHPTNPNLSTIAKLEPVGFFPSVDNSLSLGTKYERWTKVWAASGTIGTSDERHKQDIHPLNPAIMAALLDEIMPIEYRFKNNPGELRYGFGAQSLQAALDKCGLSSDLQIVNKENPDCYGLNNEQIIPILAGALKHERKRNDNLESRLTKLEALLNTTHGG